MYITVYIYSVTLQLIAMIIGIILVERALKRYFNRR
jgi:hypothetical protein